MKKMIEVCISLMIVLSIPLSGYSQEVDVQLSDTEAQKRITYIQDVLDRGEASATYWWYGWTIGYTALTAGQFSYYYVTDDEETKQDMLVGGVQSALGIVGMFIDPMVPAYAPGQLKNSAASTPEERRKKLIYAEKLLQRSAQREIDGRSWLTHVLAFVVNAGGGLVLWKHYDRPFSDGLLNFAIGTVVSEVQIFTQPMRAVEDWDNYKRKYKPVSNAGSHYKRREWFLVLYPGGLGVGIHF